MLCLPLPFNRHGARMVARGKRESGKCGRVCSWWRWHCCFYGVGRCALLRGNGYLLVELGLLHGGLEDLEGAHEVVVDGHDGTAVVELIAVIGSTEDGD